MASATIGSLRVNLGIDSAQFATGLKKAETTMAGFAGVVRRAIIPIAAGITAATVALGKFTLAIRGSIDRADAMGKAAAKFGLPVKTLSALAYAAELSDVSLESLGTSLSALNKSMVDSANGGKKTTAAFEALGVRIKDSTGALRPMEDVLLDISDVFARMPDGPQKSALAMDLMRRSGVQMIPVLNDGSAAIRGLMEEAQRLGLVITDETANAADRFGDNIARLGKVATGFTNLIAAELVPSLARFTDGLTSAAAGFSNLDPSTRNMIVVAGTLAAALGPVVVVLGAVAAAAAALGVPLAVVAGGIAAMGVAAAAVVSKLTSAAAAIDTVAAATARLEDARRSLASVTPLEGDSMITIPPGEDRKKAEIVELEKWVRLSKREKEIRDELARVAASTPPVVPEPPPLFLPPLGGGGGGGGGGAAAGISELNKALEELKAKSEQVFAATRTPMEEYAATIKELGVLLNTTVDGQTLIDLDTYNRAVLEAKETLEATGDTGQNSFKQLGRSFQSTLADMAKGTVKFGEAFSDVMAQVASALISSGIARMFSTILNPAGGGALGWIGRAIGIPALAGGTQFARGGFAMVGERGPELVHLPRGSKVTPNSRLGGGGGLVYAPVIDARGADPAAITRLELLMRSQAADFERTFRDRTMAAVADPRYRGRS